VLGVSHWDLQLGVLAQAVARRNHWGIARSACLLMMSVRKSRI
jgi:hypothetical protein